MHLGKFHAAIDDLERDYTSLKISSNFHTLINHLDSVAGNPGNPEILANFKTQLDSFRATLSGSRLNCPHPTLAAMLDTIKARDHIGDRLFQRIEDSIDNNSMSAHVASAALRVLMTEVDDFYKNIAAIDSAFTELDVEYEDIGMGQGEIGISIPQPARPRLLSDLAKTVKDWDRALQPFVEIFDPEHNPISVRTISSSDWQFYLSSVPTVYLALSGAISNVNALLGGLVETKENIAKLFNSGISKELVEQVQADADKVLTNKTRELAEKIVDDAALEDQERANELKTSLTFSLRFIASEMASDVSIEVRYLSPKRAAGNAENIGPEELQQINTLVETAAQIGRNMSLVRLGAEANKILNLPAPEDHPG